MKKLQKFLVRTIMMGILGFGAFVGSVNAEKNHQEIDTQDIPGHHSEEADIPGHHNL